MRIYIVQYERSDSEKVISSEGYKTLEEAQKFCENRLENLRGTVKDYVSPMCYQGNDEKDRLCTYKILEIEVR